MAPTHCLLVTAALASLAGPALLQEPEEEKYLEELGHLQSGGHLTRHHHPQPPPPGDVSPESVRGVPPELKKNEMRFRPPQLSDEEER